MALVPASSHGASAPVTREELYGNVVVVANGDSARLTWDNTSGPDTLLDRTNPAIPLVITAGVYSFQVTVLASGMSDGGWCGAQLKLDGAGFNASAYADSRTANTLPAGTGPLAGSVSPAVSITFTWYMPAGARVEVWVGNIDGLHANDILIQVAHVQRLS